MSNFNNEINRIINFYATMNKNLTNEQAFEIMILQYFFYKEKEIRNIFPNLEDHLTNGTNDGGIDLVYYDDDDEKLSLVQCKFSDLSSDAIIDEVRKMNTTLEAFKNYDTGAYSSKLKRVLQENLDRLSDNAQIDYYVFYIGNLDSDNFERKLRNSSISELDEMLNIADAPTINTQIASLHDTTTKVSEFKCKLDKPGNFLEYESEDNYGAMVNLSSNSLITMYNKYKDNGLFDMNIRKYIANKLVDSGIKKTLDDDRDNFWFFNNGLIIATEDFKIDGNFIKLYDFSIVNGGQTTNLLGKYKGKNNQEFYIPCKVVFNKNGKDPEKVKGFFTHIAETTNSQKPIKASDLKSNTPEMVKLRRDLENNNIDFQIKRGEKGKNGMIKIKNEEFGQLILSFVMQKPGTARSNKKALFESNNLYASVYKKNYTKNIEKHDFIIDLIKLYDRFKRIFEDLKRDEMILDNNSKDVLKNGNFILIALLGILYRLQNDDITSIREAIENPVLLSEAHFEYGMFISNYKEDDLDKNLKELIIELVILIEESYSVLFNSGEVSSVSNYFKTDKKYQEILLKDIALKMGRSRTLEPIMQYSTFLKRTKK